MSKLIVEPGHWNDSIAAEAECLLGYVGIMLGLTQKRKDFLEQIHKDIHGKYVPGEYWHSGVNSLKNAPPHMYLHLIKKGFNSDQKKQLKVWYQELLAIEPMDEGDILFKLMLPELSKLSNAINEI